MRTTNWLLSLTVWWLLTGRVGVVVWGQKSYCSEFKRERKEIGDSK